MGGVFSSDEEEDDLNVIAEGQTGKGQTKVEREGRSVGHEIAGHHRMPSPYREQPDGKEAESPPKKSSESGSKRGLNRSSSGQKLIHLPQTNIVLEKLPPIRDQVNMEPQTPSTPLVPIPTTNPVRSAEKNGFKKDKEPKFVPYEPYKGAVTPLTSKPRNKKPKRPPPKKEEKNESVKEEEPNKSSDKNVIVSEPRFKSETARYWSDVTKEEYQRMKKELEEKERELNNVKSEMADMEKQVKIQVQVNTEVKRLLVASVGEDIEAKVDFLTQDKARLSADIRQYASKISRDFEEKEKLSVESTVWKSKFLASSVIVDELARWKAGLIQHNEEFSHNARLALHEHHVLWDTQMKTYLTLNKLKSAFDPLSKDPGPAEKASLLGLADHTQKLASELKDRLIKEGGIKEDLSERSLTLLPMDTPAEEGLKEILGRPLSDKDNEYSRMASVAVTGAARPHLAKLGDKNASPEGFKCCTHCQGTVHNV